MKHPGLSICLSAILSPLLTMISASAGTDAWSGGGGGNGNWSTAAHWLGGVAPVNNTNLTFTGGIGLSNTNDLNALET